MFKDCKINQNLSDQISLFKLLIIKRNIDISDIDTMLEYVILLTTLRREFLII